MIPQIPYGMIGLGVALFLGIWAAVIAETDKERLIIIVIMVALFLLRFIWTGRTGVLVGTIGWTIFGVGAVIFIKWKGAAIRG